MTTTMNELKTMCENIREELNRLYEANFTDAELKKCKRTAKLQAYTIILMMC